jgi:hypothetical protein
MYIVLDSTAYRADLLLKGNAFRILLAALGKIGARLLLPEVVLEEVVNGFREKAEQFAAKIAALSSDARRLGLDASCIGKTPDIDSEVARYRSDLLKRLGAELIDLPSIPHVELVNRALQRRKPFSDQGAGYRDALIWQNVLDLLKSSNEQVCFVTANRRDFWDDKGLHSDLNADLVAQTIPAQRLRLYERIEDLNAELITPNLQRLDEVFREIAAGSWGTFQLSTWIQEHLADTIQDEDLVQTLSSLQDQGAHLFGIKIRKVKSAELDDVRSIPDGRVLVSATAKVEAEVGVSVDWDAYLRSAEIREFVGDSDEPFQSLWTDQFLDVYVRFSLVVDAQTHEVFSAQIDEIEGDAGSVTLQPHLYRDE